jgi:hypothetical protein
MHIPIRGNGGRDRKEGFYSQRSSDKKIVLVLFWGLTLRDNENPAGILPE